MACTVVVNDGGCKKPIMSFASKEGAIDLIAHMMVGKNKYKSQPKLYLGLGEYEIWDTDIQIVKVNDVKDYYLKGYDDMVDFYHENPITSNGYYEVRKYRFAPKAKSVNMRYKDWNYQSYSLGWGDAWKDSPKGLTGVPWTTNNKLF